MSTATEFAAAPSHRVALYDGREAVIRPATGADDPAIRRLYEELSDRSAYLRFFGLRPGRLDTLLSPADGNDEHRRVMLLAFEAGELVGIGDYFATTDGDTAEVAFTVADRHHNEGVGGALLADLVSMAKAAGFTRLVAETLPRNMAMLHLLRAAGAIADLSSDGSQVHAELDLT